jgi:hypothetical protein
MQRAAASSQTIDDDIRIPSPKRAKLSANSSFQASSGSELEAVRAALAAEEAKRDAAMERQAAEAGETRWVLSFRDEESGRDGNPSRLKIIHSSYAGIDSSYGHVRSNDEDAEEVLQSPAIIGRRSFGRFNRAIEVRLN